MSFTPVVDILHSATPLERVRIGGWVRTRRDAKGFTFLELNDGSCLANVQCIVDEGTPAHARLEGVNTGAAVAVSGALVESPGKGQKWEVRAEEMTVFGLADPESFPFRKSGIPTNSSAPSPTCGRGRTNTARPSASVPRRRWPCTAFCRARFRLRAHSGSDRFGLRGRG